MFVQSSSRLFRAPSSKKTTDLFKAIHMCTIASYKYVLPAAISFYKTEILSQSANNGNNLAAWNNIEKIMFFFYLFQSFNYKKRSYLVQYNVLVSKLTACFISLDCLTIHFLAIFKWNLKKLFPLFSPIDISFCDLWWYFQNTYHLAALGMHVIWFTAKMYNSS